MAGFGWGKESLGQLRWEQNLQLTMRNYMDAAGPLCILLQHLQSDPGSVTERSATDLILKSLRLLGHAVVNKQRRQEIVKSCNITDVTQLAKQSTQCRLTFLERASGQSCREGLQSSSI